MNEQRLKVAPILKNKIVTEEGHRPNHLDFATTSELKKLEFTGMRSNKISNCIEIWIAGQVIKEVSQTDILIDPQAIVKAYFDAFMLRKE